jgi:hypothetical protein
MNDTGKFLVSALLLHAAKLKKLAETQRDIPVPKPAAVPDKKAESK